MAIMTNTRNAQEFIVVHPLFDVAEEKRTGEGLGQMPMSGSVRWSLLALRGYLILMTLLVIYHCLDLSGLFRHIHGH
jgi:hypothetical protein